MTVAATRSITRQSHAGFAMLVLAACGGETRAPAASGTPVVAAEPGAPAGGVASATNGCPKDGRWRPCALKERLEKAGLVVAVKPDTVHYDFLAVPGIAYTVGRGEVQAFFYDDTTQLARDVAALDTVRVAPAGTLRHWDVHPTFVRSANLVVILLTLSEQLMERGQFAIQAGPPQPEPPPGAQELPPARIP